ncbi:MAG: FAD-dependent oxidoreductase [bacterium]|nr:FAD-dependent oxidoreductase [bacterium]
MGKVDGIKNIVVIGAGFGGLTATLKLSEAIKRKGLGKNCRVLLFNKTSYQVYTPALYEIAAVPRGEASAVCLKTSICIDLEDVASREGFQFIGGEVVSVDPAKKLITLASGETQAFDYLVVALGTETNFFNILGSKEHSLPLKTFEDAIRLRNKTEKAVLSGVSPIHVVIGGGGATGVELAAEFENFVCYLKEKLLPAKRVCDVDITLVEGALDILPGFEPWLVKKARKKLEVLGVKILAGKIVAGVDERIVTFKDGAALPYHIFVWAGGVMPAGAIKNFGLPLSQKGRVIVNEYLEAVHHYIFAVGDNAEFAGKDGKPLPGNVPVAEAEARVAAKNIIADIQGRPHQEFFPMKKYPYILAVGRKYAIADLVFFHFSGFWGWCAKQLIELRYLVFVLGFRKALSMWWRSVKYQMSND